MGGIVMLNLKNSIIKEVNRILRELNDTEEQIDFLREILYDTLAYLDEEELNDVKGWVKE